MQVQTVNTTQRRLRIPGDNEIKAIYGIPHFTYAERLEYFSFSRDVTSFVRDRKLSI